MRFPLFTARIMGDGITAILRSAVGFLPVSSTKRDEWRELLSRYWSWLRQKISYKAFEEAVHHAFEHGMAWVFKKCRTLTPRSALLVIAGAVLWLPASFGAATAMHGALIAKATFLPAWMQLLHPLATIIAKAKLLVLPVYPAAWPQAKKHPGRAGTLPSLWAFGAPSARTQSGASLPEKQSSPWWRQPRLFGVPSLSAGLSTV